VAETLAPPSPEVELEALVRRKTLADRAQRQLHAHPALGPFIVLVAAAVVFDLLNTRFLAARDVSLMFQQVAVVAGLAAAQTMIIITAGIDLSIGAAMILAQLVMAQVAANNHVPGVLALMIGLLVGMASGAVNGTLVARFKLPPFIATLGTLSIYTAVGLLYSNGQTTQSAQMPGLLNWTGYYVNIGPFNLTYGVLLVLAVYLAVAYILAQTQWGRHVYAVGDDVEAARLAGIRKDLVLVSVYSFAGVIVGLAAWVSIGYTGAASPNNAVDANLQSITAVVIGGTSLFGGRGSVIGSLFGALIVVVFTTGLTLANVNDLYQPIVEGILVLAAVGVDQWIRKVKA
jgi:fructose transport system permease protein